MEQAEARLVTEKTLKQLLDMVGIEIGYSSFVSTIAELFTKSFIGGQKPQRVG